MVHCAVLGCKSRSDVHDAMSQNVHFHRIPKDPRIREKWRQAINKEKINNSTRVCSLHFEKRNYRVTKQGLYKLIGAPAPSLNLQAEIDYDSTDTSENDEKSNEPNMDSAEKKLSNLSQSQQTRSKEINPNMETYIFMESSDIKQEDVMDEDDATHFCEDKPQSGDPLHQTASVPGSSNTKTAEVKNHTTDLRKNKQMQNEQFPEHTANVEREKDDEDDISEDEQLLNEADTQTPEQTENVPGSSNTKAGVIKYTVTTPLERQLLKEIKKLKELCQKRKEGMQCLLQQNRRLLKRITYLEEVNYSRQKRKGM